MDVHLAGSPRSGWSRRPDLEPVQTHDSFDTWYADWLDNAVAGLEPWRQWDGACASLDALAQAVDNGVDLQAGVKIALSGDEEGQPGQPCHFCQATLARFGLGDESWVG